jgi:group I intron endonuclease
MIRIYKLTNNFINPPKSYIGQTNKNLEDRIKEHMRMGQKGVNRELAKGLMEYGKINFTIELLEEVEVKKSHIKEDEYIRLYNTHYINGYGYNMKYEDIVSEPKIKEWNPQDIQEKTKNVKNGQVWNKGIKTKKYISEKIKNTIQSKKEEGWINSSWGHKHTNTTKKLISENKKIYYTNMAIFIFNIR